MRLLLPEMKMYDYFFCGVIVEAAQRVVSEVVRCGSQRACSPILWQLDLVELKQFVADRVAPFKQLREIHILDAIPTSASGKKLRNELRALCQTIQ